MVFIDERTGSKEFASDIPNSECIHLDCGDFYFSGYSGDKEILVGIERKTISEISASAKGDKRFTGKQLPDMLETYDHNYLIIEGIFRPAKDGILETLRWENRRLVWKHLSYNGITYEHFMKHVFSIQEKGITVLRSNDKNETGKLINTMYHWYQEKKHKSADGIYIGNRISILPTLVSTPAAMERFDRRKLAAIMPGISYELSSRIADSFDTKLDMVLADEDRWQEIDGIGKKKAKKLVEYWQS